MAEKTLTLQFKWENENYFEVKSDPPDDEVFTVVRVDENQTIKLVWTHVSNVVKDYVTYQLDKIYSEMKD